LHKDTPCIREFHNSSLVASEQVKLMLCFEVGNLFTERRLGYMQSVRGPPEVQLFGQGNDCKQVTYFNAGEHGSHLFWGVEQGRPISGPWLMPYI
jgi:hypothetical protein